MRRNYCIILRTFSSNPFGTNLFGSSTILKPSDPSTSTLYEASLLFAKFSRTSEFEAVSLRRQLACQVLPPLHQELLEDETAGLFQKIHSDWTFMSFFGKQTTNAAANARLLYSSCFLGCRLLILPVFAVVYILSGFWQKSIENIFCNFRINGTKSIKSPDRIRVSIVKSLWHQYGKSNSRNYTQGIPAKLLPCNCNGTCQSQSDTPTPFRPELIRDLRL